MADVSYADVIRTVNDILKVNYPEITRYGNDTVDKAVPPYFFVECIPAGVNRQTKNMMNKSCSVMITYVQLQVHRYAHEYIGEKNNILQISFALDWWESTQKPPEEEIMEHLHAELTAKGE